jgi:MFS family permease
MNTGQRLFIGCIVAMATIAFGLVSRAFLIEEWSETFHLSQTQIGSLQGVGLYPYALSIIFSSLVIDRVGYGRTVVSAWVGHVTSAIITMTAKGYPQLYLGTLVFALANGALEAAINPVVVSVYPRNKTRYLNLLHAGWPVGLVLGGLMAIGLGNADWRWKIGLFLVPATTYGVMMLGRRFPPQERVMAGVSYREMLEELGWAGCLVVSFFVARALHEIARVFGTGLSVTAIATMTIAPALAYMAVIRSFGRPLFVFLLLVMVVLSTTELSTDSWVTSLITPPLQHLGSAAAGWVLIYTAVVTFIPRLNAGSLLQRLTPLGLLAVASALAAAGLLGLSQAGGSTVAIFLMATLYGLGKAFFWPTTLGVVSEKCPKGGALTLNAISGVGMIAAAVVGNPLLDALQGHYMDISLRQKSPALHASVAGPPQAEYGITFQPLDKQRIAQLPPAQQTLVNDVLQRSGQATLAKIAVLPVAMLVSYLGLLLYFRRKGGYRPLLLTASDEPPLATGLPLNMEDSEVKAG